MPELNSTNKHRVSSPIYILFRRLRSPLIVLVVVYAVSILGFVLIPGVDDQGQPWKMSFFHAFYFVSYMGTTIGFGEIPYAFTDAQRSWAVVTMYASVTSWLYGIGVLLSLFQDAVFLKQIKKNSFSRKIKRIHEPFYIICGYGDTGADLVRLLSEEGIKSVVIDPNCDRINDLEVDDFRLMPLGICDDASHSEVLELAGIKHHWCKGIISIANDDTVNLTIAIVTQLLNPNIRLIARAETPEAEANILSFGANEVINPFETFASRLALALQSPSLYCLYDWMTAPADQEMREPPTLATGRWIISDFGRFGRALYDHLDQENVRLTIIVNDRNKRDLPSGSIIGPATEAPTLKKAGIEEAVGIIAGTDNDANNLSILLTASELNPDLFRVVRQNRNRNRHLFQAANYEMLMHRGSIISNTIFSYIRTPMLGDFLRIVSRFKEDRASELASKIIAVVDDNKPKLWELRVNPIETPALFNILQQREIHVGELMISPDFDSIENMKSLSAIPLFMKRDGNNILLPENERQFRIDDRVLMCGTVRSYEEFKRVLTNHQTLDKVLNGEEPSRSWLWRLFKKPYAPRPVLKQTDD